MPTIQVDHVSKRRVKSHRGEIEKSVKSPPGDPKLTFDLVSKNPEAYIGKRVTWHGEFSAIHGIDEGERSRVNYIGNAGEAKTASDFRFFVVEYESGFSDTPMDDGTITGTIDRVGELPVTVQSASGDVQTVIQRVPVLRNAAF